ncbi:MAG TPA: DUF4397 domain-containing protein, partial [Deinococcales bacterium]|nr:DUF4397 domain-containing protein [Deinococcales bacterium]
TAAAGTAVALAQQASPAPAYLRVIHASPDAPAVDIYVNNTLVLKNAPFRAFTAFGNVPAGKQNVKVTATGAPNTVVFNGDLDFASGKYYTVAATKALASIEFKVFTADSMKPADGKAVVNVYHLSPGAPAVDVLAASAGNAKLVSALGFQNKASLAVDPMTVSLNVTPAGNAGTVVKGLRDVKLEAGKSYSVFAVGLLDGRGTQAFDLLPIEDKVFADLWAPK